jgi:phosphinothricin acetyltransferase
MTGWFETKRQGRFPVWGALDEQRHLLGFATYGTFRAWPAYKYSVEHSVYVARSARGRGVGSALMRRLIEAAEAQQYHLLIGGIDADNRESIAFHERLGFVHAGTIKQAGFKFGRWLDLAFYQLVLSTPLEPRDG